jgi:hypothetical protein
MVVTLRELGSLAEQRGDAGRAEQLQEEGLALARRVGEPRLLARTLEGLAGALSLGERPREAARLLGVAEAIRAEAGARLPDAERVDVNRVSARLRDRLGDGPFEAELERGRADYALQHEQAVASST